MSKINQIKKLQLLFANYQIARNDLHKELDRIKELYLNNFIPNNGYGEQVEYAVEKLSVLHVRELMKGPLNAKE